MVSHPNYTSNKPKKNKVKHESMLKKLVKRLEEIDLLIDTIALGSTKYMVTVFFLCAFFLFLNFLKIIFII